MPVSFDRRSKVLLALVVSMTLGTGLLMMLAPSPDSPLPAYELAGRRPAPSYLKSNAPAATWHRVIIHRDRMPDSRVDNYHFVVEADGRIQATALWQKQGASRSAGRLDQAGPSIHVAVVGDFRDVPPAKAQMLKLRELIEQLVRHVGIGADHVHLHSELEDVNCPGHAFRRAWDEITVF